MEWVVAMETVMTLGVGTNVVSKRGHRVLVFLVAAFEPQSGSGLLLGHGLTGTKLGADTGAPEASGAEIESDGIAEVEVVHVGGGHEG